MEFIQLLPKRSRGTFWAASFVSSPFSFHRSKNSSRRVFRLFVGVVVVNIVIVMIVNTTIIYSGVSCLSVCCPDDRIVGRSVFTVVRLLLFVESIWKLLWFCFSLCPFSNLWSEISRNVSGFLPPPLAAWPDRQWSLPWIEVIQEMVMVSCLLFRVSWDANVVVRWMLSFVVVKCGGLVPRMVERCWWSWRNSLSLTRYI